MRNSFRLFCRWTLIALVQVFYAGCGHVQDEILIAAGAGYKKPVIAVCNAFREKTGIPVTTVFGNMQMVSAQAKQSGRVGIVIGDKNFLCGKAMNIEYVDYVSLGAGILALAYSRNCAAVDDAGDLLSSEINRLSMPDTKKAIYGKAAKEYLLHEGLWEQLQPKLLIAATVPQVSSYLLSGEIDAGFINVTDALGIADKIGGYVLIEEGYSPIEIVAGIVSGHEGDSNILKFVNFLKGSRAESILDEYGL